MDKRILSPSEVARATIKGGIKKANLSTLQMILLGIFAGVFIGFGAHADITVIQTLGGIDIGIAKFLGAAVFPVGLMLVLMAGAELFTGNNLMTLALMDRKITFNKMMKNWVIVYIGNFIGSILLAIILVKTGLYKSDAAITTKAIGIAEAKVALPFGEAFLRAILCNTIVVLAVWFATAARDIIGKIFAIWFPIMLFVLSGFEHSVANMFFISLGKMLGGNFTWMQMWISNIIPVTLGNVLGGAVIVPVVYYLAYVKPSGDKNKGIVKGFMANNKKKTA
ncbi:formate/nitrite transporter family protein [Sporosalibacterium faouarense]|uniref:formate/nitrite transporter family protein n=1 Tax=Sporosalibacterium faouarense TaxID=516123 RepID=UPI00141D2ECE|nr:formate/nitrite transporter family protein [Sporosalibacterium faouarense]MTI49822.1 formate/nitrite transporter family protein [Bacillota bacterium]